MIPTEIFFLLGGVGLFLYGMQALTAELKVMTSERARSAIRRFARKPVTGLAAGAAVTAIIQSSTATMVMTLGLVGAGVLSFGQSLGIILGANIGTTFTGWMVMLLGIKINLGTLAFPVLFVAALLRLLTAGGVARLAGGLAGLGMIFIGIDLMKDGMGVFDGWLNPESLPTATLGGRLQLLGLGVLVTVVTQSSTAGVAATIVLLSEGHVNFTQAAALVIGMTVGTTFTGILASLGGTTAMRRTALAHLIFNLTQGLVALSLLDLVVRAVAVGLAMGDGTLALVVFHTGFAVVGAFLFLPFVRVFARLIERLVPDKPHALEKELDPRFLSDPSAALDVVLSATRRQIAALFAALGAQLAPGPRPADSPDLKAQTADADALGLYLSQISLPEGEPVPQDRYGALMAILDHLRRLILRAGQGGRLTVALYEPMLRREALYFGAILRAVAGQEAGYVAGDFEHARAHGEELQRLHAKLARGQARLARREDRLRRRVLSMRAAPPRTFALTDAMRWLRRSNAHAERVLYHLLAAERQAMVAHESEAPEADPVADQVAE